MTAADALQADAHGPADGVPVTVAADGWLGDLLSGQADRRLPLLSTPGGFRGELRPYQQRGLAWLVPSSANSASVPAWPTTWAWARRSRLWPWCSANVRPGNRRPSLLSVPCPWSATGRKKPSDSRPICRHGAPWPGRQKGPAIGRRASKHALVLSSLCPFASRFRTAQERILGERHSR